MLIVASTVAAALLVAAIWASRGLAPTVPPPKTDYAPPTEPEAPRPDVGAVASSTSPETPPAPATTIARPPKKTETDENGEPTEQVKRGFIGVQLQDLDPELAEAFGIEQTRGAVVVAVVPDSPADEAGLRERDVVVAVNGRSVESALYVRNEVGRAHAGERVKLDILRDGRQRQIIATVSDGAEVTSSAGNGATADNSNESRRSRAVAHFIELFNAESLGKNVRPLTEEELQLLAEVERETLEGLEAYKNGRDRQRDGFVRAEKREALLVSLWVRSRHIGNSLVRGHG